MPNKLSRFWQELKRRNVVRVITVYAGAAFVIIELINNITEPLHLPEWTPTLVIVLLAIGFPIAVIFSWIYDVHPAGGMVKTEPAEEVNAGQTPESSSSWKIATYVSVVIIIGLIAYNIFGGNRRARIDESLAKSIAVLPFLNYTGDRDQEYMCEGLTNEIISHLFKVRTFDDVKGLSAVLPYKDSDKSPSEISQELNVNYLLEGTYLRMGERLKVTANLIEANSGRMIWTQDYDPPYNQVMGIPGNIALNVADYLRASMTEGEEQSISREATKSLEAYEIGNQIVYQFLRWAGGDATTSLDQMIELCKRAIEIDPDYAEAYGYLSFLIISRVSFIGDREITSVYLDVEQYIAKALELDPYNMVANFGRAWLDYWVKRDYVGIEEFKEAFPNALENELIASLLILYELQMGHYNEVLAIYEKDSVTDYSIKANILSGNYGEARDQIYQMFAYNKPANKLFAFEGYIWLQEFDSAMYYINSAPDAESAGNSIGFLPRYLADAAVVLFKTGYQDMARSLIGELIEASDTTTVRSPAFFTGWYYSWIGELDSAFYWLDKAVENRSVEIPWLKVDPAFNSLKDDPRYRDLYERTGFKKYDDYMASSKD